MTRSEAIKTLEANPLISASLIDVFAAVGVTLHVPAIGQRNRRGVGVMQQHIIFACSTCGRDWQNLYVDGQPRPRYWECPNGCNK